MPYHPVKMLMCLLVYWILCLYYFSYIQKKMEEEGLFATYTLQEVLDESDVIECFTEPGRSPIQGEVLKTGTDLSENGSDAMAGSRATAKGIVM